MERGILGNVLHLVQLLCLPSVLHKATSTLETWAPEGVWDEGHSFALWIFWLGEAGFAFI